MMITLVITCIILFVLTLFLSYKLYQFSILIISVEDSIEESLEILNERYKKMNEIIQKPVFFDSVEVRQVIADIKESHNAILKIANKLTNDVGIKSEQQIEKKDD